MAYRSNFPSEIDQFLEHYEIQAVDVPKVARFQELKLKFNRSPAEEEELKRLTTDLRDKIISAEDFNKFQDALVQMQVFIRDNVNVYIEEMQTDLENYANNAKTDITNTKNSFGTYVDQKTAELQNFANQKKNEIQNVIDQTTAGQLNNKIESITSERVESFIEYDTNQNPIYVYGVEEDFNSMIILDNVSTLDQRDAIPNPQENSFVFVTHEKQVYKRLSGVWHAVPKKQSARYTWIDIDNCKTIEDKYYKATTSKTTTVVTSQGSNTVNVGNNISDISFFPDATYLDVRGIRYKVNAITEVIDSGHNHVSTNVILNTPLPTTSGQIVYLITAEIDSDVTTEFVYIGGILRGIKKKEA